MFISNEKIWESYFLDLPLNKAEDHSILLYYKLFHLAWFQSQSMHPYPRNSTKNPLMYCASWVGTHNGVIQNSADFYLSFLSSIHYMKGCSKHKLNFSRILLTPIASQKTILIF